MEQPDKLPIEDITEPSILTLLLNNYLKHEMIADDYEEFKKSVDEFAVYLEDISTNAKLLAINSRNLL